jgi:amino acid transporter
VGLATGPCTINFALAEMILAGVEIGNPNYTAKTYHTYLVFLALIISNGFLTMNNTKFLARVNYIGAIINFILVFMLIIWLPAGSIQMPKTNKSSSIWGDYVNGTEWPDGFAFLMSFLSVIYTLAGYDAPFHLSEECSNANVAGPRAIVMTAQTGLWLGWACILVICYTVKNISDVVDGQYGQPMGKFHQRWAHHFDVVVN